MSVFHFTCCDITSMDEFRFTLCFTCQRWVGRDLLMSNAMTNFWSRPTHPSFPTLNGKGEKATVMQTEKHGKTMQCVQFQMSYAMTRAMRCSITIWDRTPLWPQSQKISAEPRSFPAVDMSVWCSWKVSQINYLTWSHTMFYDTLWIYSIWHIAAYACVTSLCVMWVCLGWYNLCALWVCQGRWNHKVECSCVVVVVVFV